jgi:two-component system LytT family sensor kinase
MTARFRYAIRMLAANVAAAILVSVTFSGVTFGTPWRSALTAFGIAFLFSNCIGIPVAIVVPRLGRRVWHRFPFPVNWGIVIVTMMMLAIAGGALAISLLIAIRLIEPGRFGEWFTGSLRISLIATLTVGIAVTAYELMRTRLDEATLALRTKERDEAEARRLASDAQLASLEARVQPHFLFNTLNSIAALIPRDPEGAEKMTGQLASLMRSSLDNGGAALVPLEQEVKVVRDYLDIERVRFGERLRFHIDVAAATMPLLVPRLSLQTLVENSVKYAVSTGRDGASVTVGARLRDRSLVLEVEDDGPGFAVHVQPENHGIALLKARLDRLFGDRAALTIDTRPGRTLVTIQMPADPGAEV